MFKAKDHVHIFAQIKDHARTFPQEVFDHFKALNLLALALPHIFGERDDAMDALIKSRRASDPYQKMRLGKMQSLWKPLNFGFLSQRKCRKIAPPRLQNNHWQISQI